MSSLRDAIDAKIEEAAQQIIFWWTEGMGACSAQEKVRSESTLGPDSFNKVCRRVQELVQEKGL